MTVPLPGGDTKDFINVSTIFVSSSSKYTTQKNGNADFVFRPANNLSDVVALELENYNIPIFALSQFNDRYALDFRLRNPLIFGGQWKQFTVFFPRTSFIYHTPESRASDLLSTLYGVFRESLLRDADFGGKVDIVPVADPNTLVTLVCRTLFYPGFAGYGSTECEFLFGSGPSKAISVAPIFGFDEVDIVFQSRVRYGTLCRETQSSRAAQVNMYRFLDVFLDEFSYDEPFARIFIPTIQTIATTVPEVNARARLLSSPIRKMDTLNFHLRLAGGVRPQTKLPFYFNIKVFSLSRNIELPSFHKLRVQSI